MPTDRDATRQVGTILRQFERQSARAGKNAIRQESDASFAAFAKSHNAMISRRAGRDI